MSEDVDQWEEKCRGLNSENVFKVLNYLVDRICTCFWKEFYHGILCYAFLCKGVVCYDISMLCYELSMLCYDLCRKWFMG